VVTLAFGNMPVVEPGKTSIGWIGTGVMGQSMAGHLLTAGYSLAIYNRSPEKTKSLVERGAKLAASPQEVAAQSDVVLTIVGYPSDVRQVILGGTSTPGVIDGLRSRGGGGIVVDMTTSQPSLAVELADQLAESGIASVDAPVSGGDIGAKNATLSIMAGGPRAAFDAVLPLFECMGKTIVYQGGPGAGQHTKMVNQTLVAANMIGVCEALLYAEAAGLDATSMLKSVSSGAATNWALINLAPKIIDGDFAPGFYVEHFIKDMRIALEEASRMQIAMPGLSLVSQLYSAVAAQGHARSGTQALAIALRAISNRPSS